MDKRLRRRIKKAMEKGRRVRKAKRKMSAYRFIRNIYRDIENDERSVERLFE